MSKLFVFGLGYSAAAIGALARKKGFVVAGTVRSALALPALSEQGFAPVLFDDDAGVRGALAGATHVLISAPPGETGDPVLLAHSDALWSAAHIRWIGYLSTIGVYGDRGGGWVDEDAALAPKPGRNAWRVEAEAAWRRFCESIGAPLDIFRLAGIYGPGRSPLDRVARGEARRILKPGQVFNRIHVDDIAQTVMAAMLHDARARRSPVRVLNVTDDEPAPQADVIAYAAELIGAPPPPAAAFEDAALSPMARSFYEGNKRVRNDKIKRELGVALRYPTYREGLRELRNALK